MTDYHLDESLVERLTSEIAAEFGRSGPPEGFPFLPDIPAGRYTSREFYELERNYLWTNSWIAAGRVEDVPHSGSYFLFEDMGLPLVVIRGTDGQIRCFWNTCRHRGAPLIRKHCGIAKQLRCQYHAWTYNINSGVLVSVPDERDFVGLCRAERNLHSISCDTWGGWIWINVATDCKPLREHLGKIPDEMQQFQCEHLRLVSTDHRTVGCNWKIAMDAFQEAYHLRFVHDRGGVTFLDSDGTTIGLLENGNSRMVVPPSKAAVRMRGLKSWRDFQISECRFGLQNIPTVHPIIHATSYSFTVFPNLVIPLGAIGFSFMQFFPVDIDRTNLRIHHYAPNWGDGKPPEAWSQRTAIFGQVIDEDTANLAPMQQSMLSPACTGVTLSYQERRIRHLHETIDQVIGTDRIPLELRVDKLLLNQIER